MVDRINDSHKNVMRCPNPKIKPQTYNLKTSIFQLIIKKSNEGHKNVIRYPKSLQTNAIHNFLIYTKSIPYKKHCTTK